MITTIYDQCTLFYAAFSIPLIYVQNKNNILFECPPPIDENIRDKMLECILQNFYSDKSPDFFLTNSQKLFGIIKIVDSNDFLFIGPVSNDSFVKLDLREEFNHPTIEIPEYRDLLYFPPEISFNLNSFKQLLVFLNFLFNKEILSIQEHFEYLNLDQIKKISQLKILGTHKKKEEQTLHNTYFLEQEMLNLIKQGQTEKLIYFLEHKLSKLPLNAGKMGPTPLRQAKNIFIATTTKVGNQAAIPSGMEIEEVYELIDHYCLNCEKLTSIDDILKLQYNMLFDFCEKIKENKYSPISAEIRKVTDYINGHTNQNLSLNDIVHFCNKSKSYITKKFKLEVGKTINEYIMEAKLNEAANLLTHTEMSISEIAAYLSFSSQAYFSNCFKKMFSYTPNEYRSQNT